MWMRRMRHNFLDLDTTITYDKAEQDEEELQLAGLLGDENSEGLITSCSS